MLLVKELRAFVQLRFKRDLQFEETTKDKEGFSACCKNFAATIREVYSQPTANPLRKELVHAMLGWLTMYRRCSHYGARPVDFSTMVMSDEFKAVSKETDFGSDALEHVMSEGISHNSGLFRW